LVFAVFTQVDESEIKTTRFGRVSGILNPESKVGLLNPESFESGEFCRVNDFISNPDIFPPAIFWICGGKKMAD